MKADDFAFLCRLLYDRSGLVLGPDKVYLAESRLGSVMRKYGVDSLEAMVGRLRSGNEEALQTDVIDAMMTNESFFFRDVIPFDQFRQFVLPRLMPARAARKVIRIWSAACSTGQEPYSLAMMLKEDAAKYSGWKFEIFATDISAEALERAKSGLYTQFEVQRGLPIQLLVKYLKQEGDRWRIVPEIRAAVQFQSFNLLADPFGFGVFDVVFCRNVLLYFDNKTKSGVLGRIGKVLAGDGILYLGGAETVLGITDRFSPVRGYRGLYEIAGASSALRKAVGG